MVIKPEKGIAGNDREMVQPAIKCRGREYLRIIYGPVCAEQENLEWLCRRGLKAKCSLAIRAFTLGHKALSCFVEKEPLHRVHECVFGILALASEPIDPRL